MIQQQRNELQVQIISLVNVTRKCFSINLFVSSDIIYLLRNFQSATKWQQSEVDERKYFSRIKMQFILFSVIFNVLMGQKMILTAYLVFRMNIIGKNWRKFRPGLGNYSLFIEPRFKFLSFNSTTEHDQIFFPDRRRFNSLFGALSRCLASSLFCR